jgi:LuxR family transcriptional regulator, quorum-sensing system regulator SdiA
VFQKVTMSIRITQTPGTRSHTLLQSFAELHQKTSRLGYDAMIYDFTPVPLSMEGNLITPSLLHMSNVPTDMLSLWSEHGYYQADPVQTYALTTCAPFVWSYQRPDETPLRVVLTERHQPVLDYMRDNQMPCGATVPLHLPRGGFGTITGITIGAQQESALAETLAELSFIAHAFQESVFPLFDSDMLTCQHVRLSKRERECLAWSAEGLTAKEIARKLCRSVATISLHLNTATRKLGASNRVQAVVRAMHYRLLEH